MSNVQLPPDHINLAKAAPARPVIDYANLPHLPREGIQSEGNFKYATRSLFLETAPTEEKEKLAVWCLSEHEVYAHGRWYPSAWMAYIHAADEYDALRKICGNVKQWNEIKKMKAPKNMVELISMWAEEQAFMQRSSLREALLKTALERGQGSTAATKMALQMIDTPIRGRPKKAESPPEDRDEVKADGARVLQFAR